MTLSAVRSAASTIVARRWVTLSSGGGFFELIWSRSLERRQQGFADQADGPIDLPGIEGQRGQHPQGSRLGHVYDQAALEQVGAERRRVDPLLQADAEHQPAAAHLLNAVEGLQLSPKRRPQ